jgi:hypothetical protein
VGTGRGREGEEGRRGSGARWMEEVEKGAEGFQFNSRGPDTGWEEVAHDPGHGGEFRATVARKGEDAVCGSDNDGWGYERSETAGSRRGRE